MTLDRAIGRFVARIGDAWGQERVFHRELAARCGALTPPAKGSLAEATCRRMGMAGLFAHQAEAMAILDRGGHVVVATATASGKSLIYMLPLIAAIASRPGARGLLLYPLKALAQDQLRTWQRIAVAAAQPGATAALYDGDLSAWHRRRLRDLPPNLLLTNPEMLHLSLLAHHEKWAVFWKGLEVVVIDEVHAYRGVFGAHMSQVLRRLRRICALYGAAPRFVFTSATVGNPRQLCQALSGLTVETVTRSGAPRGRRHFVVAEPPENLVAGVIHLIKEALARQLRTIVYCQSRRLTELLAIWAARDAGPLAGRISAYRAGLRPEERRGIESRLAGGELLAVITTSALELGIDIGDLDLCILVGYPGSVVATHQRGGRVGRSGQDAALVVVAGEDALDRYYLRHPQKLLFGRAEAAVINPDNPQIVGPHLVCAAAEAPLRPDDPLLQTDGARRALKAVVARGELWTGAAGNCYFARSRAPHRQVSLRGTGRRFRIVDGADTLLGEIDAWRAFRETHPGAVYLHGGRTYRVQTLDIDRGAVRVAAQRADCYTRVRTRKETVILETAAERTGSGFRLCRGQLRVTEQVTGYEQRPLHGRGRARVFDLDLPPQDMVTEGLWFTVPPDLQQALSPGRHFMGALHALEHALIGMLPLVILADRNDLGGISTPDHGQLCSAAIFVYDGVPGGAGMSREAFERFDELVAATAEQVGRCPCRNGCPGCVHSPKCGSGNRPLDKEGAGQLLQAMVGQALGTATSPSPAAPVAPAGRWRPTSTVAAPPPAAASAPGVHYAVLDIETRRSAAEVGGWHRSDRMGVSCAVLYDSAADRFDTYLEADIDRLLEHLQRLDRIVGFNIKRFDYRVLSGYRSMDFARLPTLDILESVHQYLGFRLSLDHLARVTLGTAKSADGLQALRWWKEGRIAEIIDYCRKDVAITRDLYRYGLAHGYLLFENKAGQTVRVPVDWAGGTGTGR